MYHFWLLQLCAFGSLACGDKRLGPLEFLKKIYLQVEDNEQYSNAETVAVRTEEIYSLAN